jgi:hypothetical protein
MKSTATNKRRQLVLHANVVGVRTAQDTGISHLTVQLESGYKGALLVVRDQGVNIQVFGLALECHANGRGNI